MRISTIVQNVVQILKKEICTKNESTKQMNQNESHIIIRVWRQLWAVVSVQSFTSGEYQIS